MCVKQCFKGERKKAVRYLANSSHQVKHLELVCVISRFRPVLSRCVYMCTHTYIHTYTYIYSVTSLVSHIPATGKRVGGLSISVFICVSRDELCGTAWVE